jgi:hypothetical protein
MQVEEVIQLICGYEEMADHVRLYFEEQNPLPSLDRPHGVRSGVFRDLAGDEACAFRRWLEGNKV